MDHEIKYDCPHCEMKYTLGKDGTVDGCDQCLEIVRNQLDGTVIEDYDELTEMEKA